MATRWPRFGEWLETIDGIAGFYQLATNNPD
jgi:hypothetical protein